MWDYRLNVGCLCVILLPGQEIQYGPEVTTECAGRSFNEAVKVTNINLSVSIQSKVFNLKNEKKTFGFPYPSFLCSARQETLHYITSYYLYCNFYSSLFLMRKLANIFNFSE